MNRNHTHTGNCQACGREHAIDLVKGDIAKHGYTVDWGYFTGVCSGADMLPAQKSVAYTREVIVICTQVAIELEARADALNAGTEDPDTCVHFDATLVWHMKAGYERTGKNVEIPFANGTGVEQRAARVNLVNECKHMASGNRSHAEFLTSYVLPMLGTELHSVEQAEVRHAAERAAREAKPTKAGFKRQIEDLARAYRKCEDTIRTELLRIERDERSADFDAAYYMPMDLHNWRTKHTQAVVKVLPAMASVCAEIELLFDRREQVKAAQKRAGL